MISGSLCSSPLLSRVQAGMNCVYFLVSLTSLQFPDLIFCDYGSCGVTSSEMTMGEYKCTEQCYWLKHKLQSPLCCLQIKPLIAQLTSKPEPGAIGVLDYLKDKWVDG